MEDRKGAGFCDVDGTIFRRQKSWHWMEELAKSGCLSAKQLVSLQEAKAAWERREKPFHAHDRLLVGVLLNGVKGIPTAASVQAGRAVVEKYGAHIHTFPRELVRAFADIGCDTFAISGSPGDVIRPFAAKLGMRDIRATEFEVGEDGCFTGKVREDWLSAQDKGDAVIELANAYGIDLRESVAIGDTSTDIRMMEKVGYPICYNPNRELMKEVMRRRWPIVFERKDVWAILKWKAGDYVYSERVDQLLPEALRKKFLLRVAALHG